MNHRQIHGIGTSISMASRRCIIGGEFWIGEQPIQVLIARDKGLV